MSSATKKAAVSMSDVSTVCRLAARIALMLPATGAVSTPGLNVEEVAAKATASLNKIKQIMPYLDRGSSSVKVSTSILNRLQDQLRSAKVHLAELESHVSKSQRNALVARQAEITQATQSGPTLKSITSDLLALHQTLGPFEINWEKKTLTVLIAKSVVLEGISLGDFQAVVYWGKLAKAWAEKRDVSIQDVMVINPLAPVFAWNDTRNGKSKHYHPHVLPEDHPDGEQLGKMCFGSTHERIARQCLAKGDLVSFLDIVKSVLNSYNSGNPFRHLEFWKEVPVCNNCRGTQSVLDRGCIHGKLCRNCRTDCPGCGTNICKQCATSCRRCGTIRCATCLPADEMITCSHCKSSTCGGCIRTCRKCKEPFCTSCILRGSQRSTLETACQGCREAIKKEKASLAAAAAAAAVATATTVTVGADSSSLSIDELLADTPEDASEEPLDLSELLGDDDEDDEDNSEILDDELDDDETDDDDDSELPDDEEDD